MRLTFSAKHFKGVETCRTNVWCAKVGQDTCSIISVYG